ncbi:MAG TPA: protease SohB [Pseudobdellovibrionaceae bacterium]|nr:protease SohB [Pseudobdellovibrionaceae bacterium]
MEYLFGFLVFFGKALIVLAVIAALIILIAVLVARSSAKSELELERLDRQREQRARQIRLSLMSPKDRKKELKKDKKKHKEEKERKSHTFVLDFKGDTKASQVDSFREEISALLEVATPQDEVVLRLESPGGMVHSYGLAASQLLRIKKANLRLTVCVDKVAASGGYLMACTADRIVAAPFAIVGSIGVVAQVPNLHRLLQKNQVDYKEYTAGEYKRTISILGQITEKGEEKFLQQLEDTHLLFKKFVIENRPRLDLPKIATGEHWYGTQALELGLIDEILTSDEVLRDAAKTRAVVQLKYQKKQGVGEKLSNIMGRAAQGAFEKTLENLENRRWF